MTAPFGRVLVAMVTPLHEDLSLDLPGAQALATHLADSGCDGLVVSGTTGESPTTTDEEKDRLLRAVLEAVGDRARVLTGVGTYSTAHTVELAQQAEKAGAHGLLVVTPYYSKPPQEGLVEHFRAVADATGLPLMLYDIPGRTATPIRTETLLRLAEHERIVAVKDAKGDLAASAEVIARSELVFYSGEDALTLPLLAVGAVGTVSVVGHVAAAQYAAMIDAVERGDLAAARRVNAALLPVVAGLMTRGQGAVTTKAVLHSAGRIASRAVRPPLLPAGPELVETLRADLARGGLA